jgi:hypothetical protein
MDRAVELIYVWDILYRQPVTKERALEARKGKENRAFPRALIISLALCCPQRGVQTLMVYK